MQMLLAGTALMLSAGFVFWVAVIAFSMNADERPNWLAVAALLTFAIATIGFAFTSGRVWP